MLKGSREKIAQQLFLYAVTDSSWLQGRTLANCVREAIQGGATFVQYREKQQDYKVRLQEARAVQEVCYSLHVPFVIDDDVDLALEIDADGVHVGQSDCSCRHARATLGPDKIVGVSAQTVEQAKRAQDDGADYLGVGALIPTTTKPDADFVSKETLRAICDSVDTPVVGIGGLNAQTIQQFKGCGLAGVAVVSAIFAASDCKAAAESLCPLIEEIVRS